MLGRNGQRKPGTTRGSPRRSRTAKALRISCHAVKSRCARGWGGWGRLSDDGSRQHNSGQSEDPWGGGLPILHGGARSNARPDTARDHRRAPKCAKGGCKPNINKWMPGAGLSGLMCGKAPPYMPAFQPYRGKPAVRNDREGRGNDGIVRSPGSRLDSTRLRGALSNERPYRDQHKAGHCGGCGEHQPEREQTRAQRAHGLSLAAFPCDGRVCHYRVFSKRRFT